MRLFAALTSLAISVSSVFASDNFFLSFPNIHTDSERAVFANDKWAAVYSAELGAMFTLPLDSFALPPVPVSGRETTAELSGITYSRDALRLNALHIVSGFSDSIMVLPPLSERSLAPLREAWYNTASATEVTEELSPMRAHAGRLWFGLTARTPTMDPVGGLGWYDPITRRFGKTYSPALKNYVPRWMDGRSDTLYVFYEYESGNRGGKLITFSIANGQLAELDLRAYGIAGDTLLNVSDWFATFLIATEKSVTVWAKGLEPWSWKATAYATRDSLWLQFATYDAKAKQIVPAGDFFPMKIDFPAEVYARIGNWVELLAPEGIEALLPASEWNKRSDALKTSNWGCGDKNCFTRVTIKTKGENRSMDLLNAPLMLLSDEGDSVKVGMQAGWIELDRLVPVLTKE